MKLDPVYYGLSNFQEPIQCATAVIETDRKGRKIGRQCCVLSLLLLQMFSMQYHHGKFYGSEGRTGVMHDMRQERFAAGLDIK